MVCFFKVEAITCQNSLPGEILETLFWKILRAQLSKNLSDLL